MSERSAGLREVPKYYMVMALAAVRRQLAIVGAELVANSRLERVDDVFFLDLSEARAGLDGRDLRGLVAEGARPTNWNCAGGTCHECCCRTEQSRRRNPRRNWRRMDAAGTPASAGTVTGIARVIFDPVGAHLEPGEILVAPSTDPGWTPLFLTPVGWSWKWVA